MKKNDLKTFLEKFKDKESLNKKHVNKEKIKQITLIVMACLLFGLGFMSYKTDNDKQSDKIALVENENTDSIGDVELVSSGSVVDNETIYGAIVENNDVNNNLNNKEIQNLEETVNQEDTKNDLPKDNNIDYFESVRIERDSMYSRMLETYNKMIDNENLVETQKAIAVQEIEKITNDQNAIMISENLIKNKGFEDAVVFSNSDVINVIVKAPLLSNDDIGKIQNIIEREFKVSLENVNISNKN